MSDDPLYDAACQAVTNDGLKPPAERRGLVRAILDVARPEIERVEAERDGAYAERARLLAWIASAYPSVTVPAEDVDEPGWLLLYIDTAAGQLSWHIHPRDAHYFRGVERVLADDPRAQWDDHTTEEKYERIDWLTRMGRARWV